MPLPKSYNEWPAIAQQRYQEVKRIAASLHDYINVTPEIMFRVQAVISKAEALDAGDGLLFEKAGNVIKAKFLTQTFH